MMRMDCFKSDCDIVKVDSTAKNDSSVSSLVTSIRLLLPKHLVDHPFLLVFGKKSTENVEEFTFNESALSSSTEKETQLPNDTTADYADTGSASVFGSPLKMQLIANLSLCDSNNAYTSTPLESKKKQSALLPSVPLKTARRVLAAFAKKGFEKECGSTGADMLIILCYDTDSVNQPILHGIFKGVNANQRNEITTLTIKQSGSKLKQDSDDLKIQKSHGCQLNARFSLLEEREGLGWISLDASWTDGEGKLSLTKLPKTLFTLNLCIQEGNEHSPVYGNFCELQKVLDFLRALVTKDMTEITSDGKCPALEVIEEFLYNLKVGTHPPVPNLQSGLSSSSSMTKILNLAERQDKDFTDYLWLVLTQCCSDLETLSRCLYLTFAALKKREIQVFVAKDNDTTIANLVRQAHSGIAVFPTLTGFLPVRLMAEIGVMKVQKDLKALYLANRLCTAGQWEVFFKSQLEGEEGQASDMEEMIYRELKKTFRILDKLHHCLEVVSVVDAFTEGQNLSEIAKGLMTKCRLNNWKDAEMLSYPVTAGAAMSEIKKHSPGLISRETSVGGNTVVDCLLSELPQALRFFPETSVNPADVSTILGESQDYHHFNTFARTILM